MNNFAVTTNQMKSLENASQCEGVSLYALMQNAGACLAEKTIEIYQKHSFTQGIVILTGNGNNGGDGFVCANILKSKGFSVSIILCCGTPKTELAIQTYRALNSDICVYDINKISHEIFENTDVIVDCVFGTGFHGEIRDEKLSGFFVETNALNCVKIACDIPSGIDATNGVCCSNTLKCDYTVTLGAQKVGMLIYPAREMCGQTIICDIGIPEKCYAQSENFIKVADLEYVLKIIKKRSPDSHKGNFGKLLNISGSECFVGAAALSSLAALRSGVGICTLASTRRVISYIAGSIPETTYLPLDENEYGQIGFDNFNKIISQAEKSSAVLIGCGLGISDDTKMLVQKLIETINCPVILDADGINDILDRIDILRRTKASIILTPHPGELARLLGVSTKTAFEKRVELSAQFAKTYGVTIVSKGAGTIIASPDGKMIVSTVGNAGLSRGGSGDVLAGMIGSFIAHGISPLESACAGVYLHGLSADRVSEKMSMQGMLPSDVINELPLLFKDMDR